jgi:hypothetical protein
MIKSKSSTPYQNQVSINGGNMSEEQDQATPTPQPEPTSPTVVTEVGKDPKTTIQPEETSSTTTIKERDKGESR